MKRLFFIALVIAPLVLAGCTDSGYKGAPADDVSAGILRIKLFEKCMSELPAGPVRTHYNDWDEIVSECNTAAWYQTNGCDGNADKCLQTLFPQEDVQ